MVIVENGKIRSVGDATVPAGATVIDPGDATLLPGFIDAPTHLTVDFDSDYNAAQLTGLQKTVDTVRDVGSSDFARCGPEERHPYECCSRAANA